MMNVPKCILKIFRSNPIWIIRRRAEGDREVTKGDIEECLEKALARMRGERAKYDLNPFVNVKFNKDYTGNGKSDN